MDTTLDIGKALEQLPDTLETLEDYEIVCSTFVSPFLEAQADKIAALIGQLHEEIATRTLSKEELNQYVDQINEIGAFAKSDHPFNPFFKRLMELEQKLEASGQLTPKD